MNGAARRTPPAAMGAMPFVSEDDGVNALQPAASSVSVAMTLGFLVICMSIIWWIFKTGYRLKH